MTSESRNAGLEALPPSADGEISLWEIGARLLRARRFLVLVSVAGFLLATTWVLLQPRTYTSGASVRPQVSQQPAAGRVSLIAAQLGLSFGGGASEGSPEFYAEVLQSRNLLLAAVEEPFRLSTHEEASIEELLEIENSHPEIVENAILKWLRNSAVDVSTSRETGTVHVTVTTRWPVVSQTLARRLIEGVDEFNVRTRRSQASAERAFVESQLREAEDRLLEAERALQQFLASNRQFENSPSLQFEFERLRREVEERQQIATSLAQAFQEARIAEVRDTPVITIVQPPFEPGVPDRRGLRVKALVGTVLAFLLGTFWVLFWQVHSPSRTASRAAYDEVMDFVRAVRRRDWRSVILGR